MGSNGIKSRSLCLVINVASLLRQGRIYALMVVSIFFTALMWLRYVDQVVLTRWDILGGIVFVVQA